jgi:nicotinamide-nucleotide amidase
MTEQIDELSQLLGQQLVKRQWQVTCAESCTGGGLGFAITGTAGSSAWFSQGFITYSNQAKSDLLGVSDSTLTEFGAVSQQTVEQMAKGAAHRANAKVAVSVSGIAGPEGGSQDKPVGTVWFGFFVDGVIHARKQQFNGDRAAVRSKAIEFGLSSILALLK